MKIEYHPLLERELREIINYYNRCSQGLGIAFLDEFDQHIVEIASRATRWMIVEGDIRRALMNSFPYVIYFRALENDVLRVVVVKHQRRHPDYGCTRR